MAMADPAGSAPFPAAIVACVQQATIATFGAICGAAPVSTPAAPDGQAGESVVGVISLVGDMSWSLMLELPRETATRLALSFAGFEIPFDSADMGDAVGELANVLAGDVSARLDALGIRTELSLPTVARGRDLHVLGHGQQASWWMRFESVDGPFWLRLATAKPA